MPQDRGISANPPGPQGEDRGTDLLRSLLEGERDDGEPEAEESPPPEEAIPEEAPPPAPPVPEQPEPDEDELEANSHLPEWLRGSGGDRSTAPPPAPEWDEDLDFSDLPGWSPEEGESPFPISESEKRRQSLDFLQEEDEESQLPTDEGTGLLAGVRGLIPVEPVITLTHDAPPFPDRTEPEHDPAGANLFARIAGGAVVPAPIARPEAPPRGISLLNLLLLLAVIVPLAAGVSLFPAPPELPAAAAFGQRLDELPPNSRVLLAFEYESGMSEELDPAVIATLNRLRAPGAAGEERARVSQLIAVSTTTQGPALAERAWRASEGAEIDWQNMRFLPGGSIGLRTFLTAHLAGRTASDLDAIQLIIVIGNETKDIQRWIEQASVEGLDAPILAIAPTIAETTLTPYMASGQLGGFLAGLPGTVSFELYSMSQGGIGWRRIDAVTLAALLVPFVILIGNLVALARRRRATSAGSFEES